MIRRSVSYDFSDRFIIVTGASKGIGRAIARALLSFGAHVGITGRNAQELQEIYTKAHENGHHCEMFVADLADTNQLKQMANYFISLFGKIDGLVNNAGINITEEMGSITEDALRQIVSVNLIAPILLTNELVSAMKGEGGSVVNVASLSSVTAFTQHTSYCASKEGVLGFTKVAAMELGRYAIRVNSVAPTVVLTDMGKEAWGKDMQKREKMESFIPLGRFLEEDDVVQTVLFLLSEASSMISGECILIDGGYMSGKGI